MAVEVGGERGDALAALWDLGAPGGAVMTFCREGESEANPIAGVQAERGRVELQRGGSGETQPTSPSTGGFSRGCSAGWCCGGWPSAVN